MFRLDILLLSLMIVGFLALPLLSTAEEMSHTTSDECSLNGKLRRLHWTKLSLMWSRSEMNYSFFKAVSTMICSVFFKKSNCEKQQEIQDHTIDFLCRFGISYIKEDQIHQLNFIIDFRLIHISSKVRNLQKR